MCTICRSNSTKHVCVTLVCHQRPVLELPGDGGGRPRSRLRGSDVCPLVSSCSRPSGRLQSGLRRRLQAHLLLLCQQVGTHRRLYQSVFTHAQPNEKILVFTPVNPPIRDILAIPLRLPQAVTTATKREELEVIAAMGAGS